MRRLGLAIWMLACAAVPVRGQGDGIFADFSTSAGDFTVRLDYERAPRAVASFVGLATGEKAWADPQGAIWNRPFYDGSIFHRVVKGTNANGIAIQGGGLPRCGIVFTNLPFGPAESDGGTFVIIGTNTPGVTTNYFGPVPLTTENAAAVPTNYTYAGEVVATNAPALTRTVIFMQVSSSNASQYVVSSHTSESWFTNRALQTVTITNWATVHTVTTNPGPGNEVLTHRIALGIASTATVWGIHRVDTNFVNAGYYMLDSATNGLSHSNGVIAMANSGPNTDGSQFFILATNWPSWDGSYTVFGHVVSGQTVVAAIADAPVQGSGSRPVADVALNQVAIRRVGAAAEAFSVEGHGLPSVWSAPISVSGATGATARIEVEVPPWSEILFRVSTNGLRSWQLDDWGYFTNAAAHLVEVERPTAPAAFFHASAVSYIHAWTAPTGYRGRVFSSIWNTDPPTLFQVQFSANSTGPNWYYREQGTNIVAGQLFTAPYAPAYSSFPYSAKLFVADNFSRQTYSLWFDPGKATNRFTVVEEFWTGGTRALSGVFTLE